METLEWSEYLEIEDIDFIEHVKTTGRLEPLFSYSEEVSLPSHEHRYNIADGGWEALERHCAEADRSNSVYFTDEMIERRRRERALAKAAWKVELKRRARLATANRLAAEQERKRLEQEKPAPVNNFNLSPAASDILALLLPGGRWNIDSISAYLNIPPLVTHAAVRELVWRGMLRPAKPPQVPWP